MVNWFRSLFELPTKQCSSTNPHEAHLWGVGPRYWCGGLVCVHVPKLWPGYRVDLNEPNFKWLAFKTGITESTLRRILDESYRGHIQVFFSFREGSSIFEVYTEDYHHHKE